MTKRQELQRSPRVDHGPASQTKNWMDCELAGSEFRNVRLNNRFRKLSRSSPTALARAFRWFARTEQIQKRRIVSFPTTALPKGISWRGIFVVSKKSSPCIIQTEIQKC